LAVYNQRAVTAQKLSWLSCDWLDMAHSTLRFSWLPSGWALIHRQS